MSSLLTAPPVRHARLTPPPRTVTLHAAPWRGLAGLVTVRTPREAVCYLVAAIPAPGADAWTLTKNVPGTGDPEADAYAVNLTARSCECRGYLRHGHCKHLESLQALRERGILPAHEDALPWPEDLTGEAPDPEDGPRAA